MKKVRLGFVPSHRYPFDEDWAVQMRRRCLDALGAIENVEIVVPSVGLLHNGLVRDDAGAKAVIDLFAKNEVQGVILGTMTFGDEISAVSVAEALDVPVLVFGTKEGPFTSDGGRHSDSFCGTLSVTSGLYRRKLPYVFVGIVWPEEDVFARTVESFARACAAVEGFFGARVGMVGVRPERFESCNVNEVALIQRFRQRVVPISLPEVFGAAEQIAASDHRLLATLEDIKHEANCSACSAEAVNKAARLELTLARYFGERDLDAMAISCWNDVQQTYGICACSTLSRLTGKGLLASCEVDVLGALTMLAQRAVSLEATVPHFIDWTIQHQEMDNVFLAWHCGNAPVCLANDPQTVVMREQAIMSQVVGADRAQGAIEFQLKPGVVTLARLVEYDGEFKMLVTKGELIHTSDKLRGSWGWVKVADLSHLYRVLAEEGFIHHASMIHGDYVDAMESFCKFTGIQVVRV
ncbi:MAG: L-fucose/L-arabinose isomerase family protein [Anaerolineae bacterium]